MSKIKEDFDEILNMARELNLEEGKVRAYFVTFVLDDANFVTRAGVAKGTPVAMLLGPVEDTKLQVHLGCSKVVREK